MLLTYLIMWIYSSYRFVSRYNKLTKSKYNKKGYSMSHITTNYKLNNFNLSTKLLPNNPYQINTK